MRSKTPKQTFLLLLAILCVTSCSQKQLSIQELTQQADTGNVEAQYCLGKQYFLGQMQGLNAKQSRARAFKWLMKSAIHGYPLSEYLLGELYIGGKGVVKNQDEGFRYVQRAAEHGVAIAQNRIGERYLRGEGVEKDFKVATQWFRKSAQQGLAGGQYNLGQRYFKAEGVEQSDAESATWLLKAANQGHGMAQYLLGIRYAEGGVDRIDYIEAYKWASLSGNQKTLPSIKKKMSDAQLKEAEEKIAKFQPVLELDPLEPPDSNLIYWLMGIPICALYAVAFWLFLRKRKSKTLPIAEPQPAG